MPSLSSQWRVSTLQRATVPQVHTQFFYTQIIEKQIWNNHLSIAGKLNLVDLAGSERIAKSGAEGSRLREAQCINKSLSALGDVINALRSKHSHVPFRNSRLTYLLQDSLSGDSKTLMMVQVCHISSDIEGSAGLQWHSVCGERLTLNLHTYWVDYNGFMG